MWTSHTSPNINPRTPNHRTFKSHPWTIGKTPRDHKNDPRMQIKTLLPRISEKNQTMGNAMRTLYQVQKNQHQPNPSENDQQHRTRLGTERLVTMIDVFSRYFFAYPTQNVTAKTIGQCRVDVMTRHAYLPTLILSDKGSQFRSEIVAKKTQILEIQISHASTKHAQTIGIQERTHASIKAALKITTGERRPIWHKYVQIAVMNYNKTYHETLGCEPSTVFHGRIPYNVLDLKLGIKPKWKTTPNSDIAEQLQKEIDEVRATAKDNIMLSYLKYKNTTTAKRRQPRSK